MRRMLLISTMVPLVGACSPDGAGNEKEAILAEDCGTAATTSFDEWSGEDSSVPDAVAVFDALDGDWSAVDACEDASLTFEITPCAHEDVSVIDADGTCDSLALVSATVVVAHPTLGTLNFPMDGTLNDPGGWNVVDLNGVAAEDEVRLSLTFDGAGGVVGSFMRTSGQEDSSCRIEDIVAE